MFPHRVLRGRQLQLEQSEPESLPGQAGGRLVSVGSVLESEQPPSGWFSEGQSLTRNYFLFLNNFLCPTHPTLGSWGASRARLCDAAC